MGRLSAIILSEEPRGKRWKIPFFTWEGYMTVAQRRAEVIWEGNLVRGNGRLSGASGAFAGLPITWAARTERSDGKTSPEELIAAAHAGCYAMAFSHALTQRGMPPTQLHVTAVCTLDRVDGALKITAMDLRVRGQVPGLDQAAFAEVAREAENGCPVSNALRNSLEIRLEAQLEQA
jgi:osmotically inducible protein OsmC